MAAILFHVALSGNCYDDNAKKYHQTLLFNICDMPLYSIKRSQNVVNLLQQGTCRLEFCLKNMILIETKSSQHIASLDFLLKYNQGMVILLLK